MLSTLRGTKKKPSKCCSTSNETLEELKSAVDELLLLKPSTSSSQPEEAKSTGTLIKKSKAKNEKDVTEGFNSATEKCRKDENGLCMHQRKLREILAYTEEYEAWLVKELQKLELSKNDDDDDSYEDVSSDDSDNEYKGDSEVSDKEDSSDGSVYELPVRGNEAACASVDNEIPFGGEARYPKRNVPLKNYQEDEMSDDDEYLFCADCKASHKGACPVHGPMFLIKDTPVPNDGSVADRAVKTLPCILSLGTSNVKHAGLGVWTNCPLPKGRVFGPYEGIVVQDGKEASKKGYSWLVRKHGKALHYIDASDMRRSNWLRFVNCAVSEERQNLVAFQYQGQIYYRTYKDVLPHCELMVWYGDSYAKDLGIDLSKVKGPAPPKPIIRAHQCGICQRLFSREVYLKAHEKHHRNESVPSKYKCPDCPYLTNRKDNFESHMLTHTGEKPFKCSHCDKCFSQKVVLKRHFRIHTGEKPYGCNSCGKKFNHLSNLNRHLLALHSNEKPHVCEWCAKSFVTESGLTDHERTHNGQKPYHCPHCEGRFSQISSLKRHIRCRHKDVL